MRQPLEDGSVTIARALNSTTFPANFMLIAALNPCPCGYRGDSRRSCHCTPPQIERYMSKISGPLVDRIDIHIEVPSVAYHDLSGGTPGTPSTELRAQVATARAAQAARFNGGPTRYNADMSHRQTRQFCPLDETCQSLLKNAMAEMGLSAAPTTRSSASPARSPTWNRAKPSSLITSTRRSTTGCSTDTCGREGGIA